MRTYFHDTHLKDRELEICVEYSQTPFDPGVSHGPAEACYPPEGGDVEIIEVWTEPDGRKIALTEDEEQAVVDEILQLPVDYYDDGPDPDELRDMRD